MTPVQTAPLASHHGSTAGTVKAFTLMGVPVRLHFTFLLLLAFVTVSVAGNVSSYSSYALFLAGSLVSILLHELGHAAVAAQFGVRTTEIVMFPIGGLARMERPLKPGAEIVVALAGPVVNIVLTAAISIYILATGKTMPLSVTELLQPDQRNVAALLLFGNLLLAVVNLFPAFPMDGGRILRALLCHVWPTDQATRAAAWMGRMLAIGMGLYGLLGSQFMLVFFAFFIYLGAAQESVAALGRTLSQGIPVRVAMITEFHTLGHGSTIRDAANLMLSTSQQDFPVMHGDQIIGLLGRAQLTRTIASEGPDAYVSGAMERNFLKVEPETDLAAVLPVMARAGRCAVVVKDGNLLGLLTTENLSEFLLLRRFGMEPVL